LIDSGEVSRGEKMLYYGTDSEPALEEKRAEGGERREERGERREERGEGREERGERREERGERVQIFV